MFYKEHFEKFKRNELMAYARDGLQLKGISALKKADLIERITATLTDTAAVAQRFAVLTDGQIDVFERAAREPFALTEAEVDDACVLYEYDCAVIQQDEPQPDVTKMTEEELNAYLEEEHPLGTLIIPEELKAAYAAIDTVEFHTRRQKISWLVQCLQVCEHFYGMTPIRVLKQVYEVKAGCQITEREVVGLLHQLPLALIPSVYLEEAECGEKNGAVVVEYLMEEDAWKVLVHEQAGKGYYIPTYSEMEDLLKNFYLSREPAYQVLKKFLQEECQTAEDIAADICCELWNQVSGEPDLNMGAWMQARLGMENVVDPLFWDKMMPMLQHCGNTTRMMVHCGFQPEELAKKSAPRRNTAIGGGQVSGCLNVLAPELRSMRLNMAGNAGVQTITVGGEDLAAKKVKIGRNDPCPCGSGKKYKKCCGR